MPGGLRIVLAGDGENAEKQHGGQDDFIHKSMHGGDEITGVRKKHSCPCSIMEAVYLMKSSIVVNNRGKEGVNDNGSQKTT